MNDSAASHGNASRGGAHDRGAPQRRLLPPLAVQPPADRLYYVPLGGTGEIGMNLNLYGHAGAWLMADCGMMMDREHGGRGIMLPDIGFIEAHRESLLGILLTHAHQDHIGALPWLWPRLRCPLYATRFTAAVIARQLAERLPPALLEAVELHIVDAGARLQLGPFAVEWVTLTHSIPEPSALHIRTAAGDVFHSGDWKLDPTPVVGADYDETRLRALGRAGVGALVGDSTNANVAGRSGSEASLVAPLTDLVLGCPGRVVVSCFASNVARLVTLARVARDTGRRLCLLGRSLEHMLGAARACGYFDDDVSVVPARHVAYLPRDEVLAVATGSQGEPGSALVRMAGASHPHLDLEAGDRVIYSARRIPGNEAAIDRTIGRLRERGVEVVEDGNVRTHVSGHPCAEELRALYTWLRPRLLVPTHGEPAHLAANAALARRCGIGLSLAARNGDVCVIGGGQPGILGSVPAGRVRLERDAPVLVPRAALEASASPGG